MTGADPQVIRHLTVSIIRGQAGAAGTPLTPLPFVTLGVDIPFITPRYEGNTFVPSIIIPTGAQPGGGGAFFGSGHPHREWTYWRSDPSIARRPQLIQIDSEELHAFFTTQPHQPFPWQENSGFISPKVAEVVLVVMPPELQKFLMTSPGWKVAPNYVVDVSQRFSMGVPYPILLGIEALHFVVGQPRWQSQTAYVFDSSSTRMPQIANPVAAAGSDYDALRRRRR